MRKLLQFLLLAALLFSTGCATRGENESENSRLDDVVEIKPNETAFVIPATGGNQSDQQRFQSIDYLESVKVPAKRYTIAKELVGGKYVPTELVILVDRTPVARNWTADIATGSEALDQSLCVETVESIRVCFQLTMGAAILEENAATYLYYYPTTKLEDDSVSGVYKATPLSQVVDEQVRGYMFKLLGERVAPMTLAEVIASKNDIVTKAELATQEFFLKQGITVIYVGLGGELGLDPEIQAVINKLFIAQQEIEVARLEATKTVIDAEAAAEAARIKAEADAKALAVLTEAIGGDPSLLGPALESYRWNGSRVIVMLAPDTDVPVAIPLPTNVPTGTPVPTATPSQ